MQPGDTKQKGKEREPRVKCIPNVAGALLGRSDNSVLSAAPSPTELLRHTLKVQAAITFYLHSFLLILFLSALSAAIGTTFDLKPDSRFMEYVWKGAYGVSSTRIVRINTSNQSALMNEASILGLDVHQATIWAPVLDAVGKLVLQAILETNWGSTVQRTKSLRPVARELFPLTIPFIERAYR